jgi:hypothetical protein
MGDAPDIASQWGWRLIRPAKCRQKRSLNE